ncbi:MAG TPA: OmpA family protein [Gemmatimonadales bacterium]|nr:OmpA family protein [Gemmatimonadales bacterium]
MMRSILLPSLAAAAAAQLATCGVASSLAAQGSAPAGAAPATTVPFGVGVVYNYVMHNLDRPEDWQFFTTVTSISPDETLYTEETTVTRGGQPHPLVWLRRVSRREAANSRIIDNGESCNPGDTTDAWHRGSTLRMASQRLYRQLKTEGNADVTIYFSYGCSKPYTLTGTITVDPKPVTVPILLNGQPLELETMHARGTLTGFEVQLKSDFWILDDSIRPWVVRQEGVMPGKSYLQQLGTIMSPDPKQEKSLEDQLNKRCRAPIYGIYFETNSAALNQASRPTLQQIADIMHHHPDWTLTIEGHTDSIGGAKYNQDLSDRRAAAVKTELTTKYDIPAAKLQPVGYGLSKPVDKNSTIEGRARNRRVELTRAC